MRLRATEGGSTGQSATSLLANFQIIVGIPVHNEEIRIGSTILSAKRYADDVVVVDDGSTDDTLMILEQADVTVLQHEHHRGRGAAVCTLLEHFQQRDCDAFVLLDADGPQDPSTITSLAEPIVANETDMIIESPISDSEGDEAAETPIYRRFGRVLHDYCSSQRTETNLTETEIGLRSISPRALDRLSLTIDELSGKSALLDSVTREDLTITESAPITQ